MKTKIAPRGHWVSSALQKANIHCKTIRVTFLENCIVILAMTSQQLLIETDKNCHQGLIEISEQKLPPGGVW